MASVGDVGSSGGRFSVVPHSEIDSVVRDNRDGEDDKKSCDNDTDNGDGGGGGCDSVKLLRRPIGNGPAKGVLGRRTGCCCCCSAAEGDSVGDTASPAVVTGD